MLFALFIAVALFLAITVGWHLVFPLVGGIITLSLSLWGFIIATVVVFCSIFLATLIATSVGIAVLGVFALAWGLVGIVLFPILFPLLLPLIITALFISWICNRRKKRISA